MTESKDMSQCKRRVSDWRTCLFHQEGDIIAVNDSTPCSLKATDEEFRWRMFDCVVFINTSGQSARETVLKATYT
jgi:hypothetical protein